MLMPSTPRRAPCAREPRGDGVRAALLKPMRLISARSRGQAKQPRPRVARLALRGDACRPRRSRSRARQNAPNASASLSSPAARPIGEPARGRTRARAGSDRARRRSARARARAPGMRASSASIPSTSRCAVSAGEQEQQRPRERAIEHAARSTQKARREKVPTPVRASWLSIHHAGRATRCPEPRPPIVSIGRRAECAHDDATSRRR